MDPFSHFFPDVIPVSFSHFIVSTIIFKIDHNKTLYIVDLITIVMTQVDNSKQLIHLCETKKDTFNNTIFLRSIIF